MQRPLASPRAPSPARPAAKNPGKGATRERTACNASTPGHPDVMPDHAQHTPAWADAKSSPRRPREGSWGQSGLGDANPYRLWRRRAHHLAKEPAVVHGHGRTTALASPAAASSPMLPQKLGSPLQTMMLEHPEASAGPRPTTASASEEPLP